MEKYIKDGKVAVMVSYGWGAGWSTWSCDRDFYLKDRGLVELALNNAPVEAVEGYLELIGRGEDHQYMGGWPVCIEWLDIGEKFDIGDFDGAEHLTLIRDLRFTA